MASTIAAALVAAQRAAKAVAKDGHNNFDNYDYVTAEGIMAEAREALNGAGLATIMESWDLLPPTHDGAPERIRICFVTYHAESADTLCGTVEYFVIPVKGRPLDKATATALTHAEGYYLRGLLCLPRVDASTDADQRDDRASEPPPARPAARPPAPASATPPAAASSLPATPEPPAGEGEMGSRGQASFFHAMRAKLGWSEDDARAWFASQPGANGVCFLSEVPKTTVTKILETMKTLADKVSPPVAGNGSQPRG